MTSPKARQGFSAQAEPGKYDSVFHKPKLKLLDEDGI
jgi:hypothetical protein